MPPTDTRFVQRKISGMALLAARLKGRVNVQSLVARHMSAEAGSVSELGQLASVVLP